MESPFKEIFISKSKHQGNHLKIIIINSWLKWSSGDLHCLKISQNTETVGARQPDEFCSSVKFAETSQVPLYISRTRKKDRLTRKLAVSPPQSLTQKLPTRFELGASFPINLEELQKNRNPGTLKSIPRPAKNPCLGQLLGTGRLETIRLDIRSWGNDDSFKKHGKQLTLVFIGPASNANA